MSHTLTNPPSSAVTRMVFAASHCRQIQCHCSAHICACVSKPARFTVTRMYFLRHTAGTSEDIDVSMCVCVCTHVCGQILLYPECMHMLHMTIRAVRVSQTRRLLLPVFHVTPLLRSKPPPQSKARSFTVPFLPSYPPHHTEAGFNCAGMKPPSTCPKTAY